MATEIMGLSQAVSICEAYRETVTASEFSPIFHVTSITGILDDFFKFYVETNYIAVSTEALKFAGSPSPKRNMPSSRSADIQAP
jgi:transaldolase